MCRLYTVASTYDWTSAKTSVPSGSTGSLIALLMPEKTPFNATAAAVRGTFLLRTAAEVRAFPTEVRISLMRRFPSAVSGVFVAKFVLKKALSRSN